MHLHDQISVTYANRRYSLGTLRVIHVGSLAADN